MELKVDASRLKEYENSRTGIYVRAQLPDGDWDSVDIVHLTSESLLEWLRSRGGDSPYAEDVVGILLGYGHLHSYE